MTYTILNSEAFARSANHCLRRALEVINDHVAQTWLEFAVNDFKVCIQQHRREIKNEQQNASNEGQRESQ